jgi:hypothetical protein
VSSSGIGTRFCRGLIGLVFGAVMYMALYNGLAVLRNGTPPVAYPISHYMLLPIAGTAADPSGRGATGADFSQVYTSALAVRHGQSGYHPTDPAYRDHFDRPPAYPPYTNFVYGALAGLPYYQALLVHTAVTFGGLLAASAFLLFRLGLWRHVWRVVLAISSFYFLTPIGVAHLERGQFDCLVATAHVLCLCCWFLPGSHFGLAILCGLVGALKWSSAPFLGCFAALCFLLSSRAKRWVFFSIPLVMVLVTVVFWSELKGYWVAVRVYELDASALGLTLDEYLPRWAAKATPVIITSSLAAAVFWRSRSAAARARILRSSSVPFALALTNVSVCYQTTSYEYHTMVTLAMIPALVVWAEREFWVSGRLKVLVCAVFSLLLMLVFRALPPDRAIDVHVLNALYALTALLFFGVSLYVALSVPRLLPGESDPRLPEPTTVPG